MSESAKTTAALESELRGLHAARTAAEMATADRLCPGSDVNGHGGEATARVLVIKGLPGPTEAAGGVALSGPDGDAVRKALSTLGWSSDDVFCALSAAIPECSDDKRARRLRAIVETVDPELVLLLDEVAGADFSLGYEIDPVTFGEEMRVHGRRVVAVDGLERSLGDEQSKRRVWNQLRVAGPPNPVY